MMRIACLFRVAALMVATLVSISGFACGAEPKERLPRDNPKRVRGLIQYVRRLAKLYGLTIHLKGKLQELRCHQQRKVTGLVVNARVQLPRKTRRWLRAVELRRRTKRESLTEAQWKGWEGCKR